MTGPLIEAPVAGGCIYVVGPGGHRRAYVELLSPMFELDPHLEPMSWTCFSRLLKAERMLFATLDDHVVSFAALCLLRRLRGRSTVGLFFRFHPTVDGKRLVDRAKRTFFSRLKRIKGVGLVTILPFSIDPRYASVATDGACDPQLWDMHDGEGLKPLARNAFHDLIKAEARGRRVVALPGSLTRIKGFGLMAETLAQNPALGEDILFVAAGKLDRAMRPQAEVFTANGGLLVDRRISDAELEGLYAASNVIWCCYTPDYDQASGIFGRAVQFGIPAVVRRGSLIERFARDLAAPVVATDLGDLAGLGRNLKGYELKVDRDGASKRAHAERIGALRQTFIDIIAERLGGRVPNDRVRCGDFDWPAQRSGPTER